MKRLNFLTLLNFLLMVGLLGGPAFAEETSQPIPPMQDAVTQGALRVKVDDEVVECPLKHTDVEAEITGFLARVTVTQTFSNPYDENIEAVYVFPLPHTAAVDAMTMHIGDRKIVGLMKRRAEARAVYEQALQQGQTASLLEQERPNIFTQSVGNIKPHQEIQIEISYVDVLNYDMGIYEFHFPMVVGPRYIPGAPISEKPQLPKELEGKVGEVEEPLIEETTLDPDPSGTGWSPDTTRVPDASRITPPVLKPGYRTGHDISLSVSLDAGVPVQDIESVNHAAKLERIDASQATVEILPTDSIPNKDFVMKYAVVGEKPEMAVFAHATGPEQRYFMLMIQPKLDTELPETPPRELVFLVDTSGSMSGEPMAKVKAAMRHFFALSKPDDTFQVITFANWATQLFENPVSATEANVARALAFTQEIQGGGGTEMLAGVKTALNAPVDPDRVRIVVMLTDGYIGNEGEIISEVGKRAGDQIRFWVIGIGSSVNRFLIDGVAKAGGGMSGVLDLNTNPKPLVTEIVERIHRAQLANIQMDWNDLPIYETYPRRIPELWAGRPVVLFGRYAAGGSTEIEISGSAEGKPLTYTLDVTLPDEKPTHDVLAKVWARRKIEDLSAQMYHEETPEVIEEITRIALDYRLMSQYTSFVAVDESEIPLAGQQAHPPRQVIVPVPLPEGVNFHGIFGKDVLEEEPQFFYDLFGKELFNQNGEFLGGAEVLVDASAALAPSKRKHTLLTAGSFRGRYTEFAIGDSKRFLPTSPQLRAGGPKREFPLASGYGYGNANALPSIDSARLVEFRAQASIVKDFEYVPGPGLPADGFQEQRTTAQKALVDAQALQKQGHLAEARLRYQHAFALAGEDTRIEMTAMEAIWTLGAEIAKKRAEVYPGLSRKLDVILRNQPLADAIHTVVNAGGFQLDVVPGSLKDVEVLLNVQALRVPYLDLRHATVVQGLEWLLAPYHLTWHVKAPDTLTVGTARRLPEASVWGYDVLDLAMPLADELDENAPQKSVENVLADFLTAIRIVINQKEEGIQPGSAVLLDAKRLLVYGDPEIHQKVEQFLEALREGESDVASIAHRRVSEAEGAALKALQKLTIVRWKTVAEARKKRSTSEAQQRIVTDLRTMSWQLLAEALNGTVDLEALTRLQIAWQAPQMTAVIEDADLLPLAMRSAWCIRTAARLVSTDGELTTFSENILSKVKGMRTLRSPRDHSFAAYLGTLYAVLSLDGNPLDVRRALLKEQTNADVNTARLIAQSLLSPSPKSDKVLQGMLSSHQISDEDLMLLACLAAKRRGGHLWQTFREELPDMVRGGQVNGFVLVIISRLQALNTEI